MKKNHVWIIEWEIGRIGTKPGHGRWGPRHSIMPGITKKQAQEYLRGLKSLYPTIQYRLKKYEAVS